MTDSMTYFLAIATIAQLLDEAKVPFTVKNLYEGYQLRFPWHEGDVACHIGTYCSGRGLVETYQFPWDDDDISILTPKTAADRIIALYAGENNWEPEGDE